MSALKKAVGRWDDPTIGSFISLKQRAQFSEITN
jgi:hypothetical protein